MDLAAATCAVIPCLNEARHVGRVVAGARRYLGQVVVVDDGSSDDTTERARAAGAEVLRHSKSEGKGAALVSGLAFAERAGADWALCVDGDGQHEVDDIPGFLHAAATVGAPLIVGNRFAESPRMPWIRRRTNRVMSRLISRLVGHEVPDSQCGFRLIHLRRWRDLGLESRRFEIESEMIVAGYSRGWPIAFVPVRSVYADETSKIDPVRDGWRWIQWYRTALRRAKVAGARGGASS